MCSKLVLTEKSRVEDERKLDELSQKLEEAIAIRQETEAKLAHAEKKIYELEQLSGKGKVSRFHLHHPFLVFMCKKLLFLVDWGCAQVLVRESQF
jgi:hypothetical protein